MQKKTSTQPKKAAKSRKPKISFSDEMSAIDARRLLHELHAHQVELDMQNEELRAAQEALEESRSRYSDLYDFAPIGYFTFDKDGLILESNLTGAEQLGIERSSLIKKPFSRFIHKDDADIFYLHRREVMKSKARRSCEVRIRRRDGTEFYAQLVSSATKDGSGNTLIRSAVMNVTESRMARNALTDSETKYRNLVDNSLVGIFKTNLDGKFLLVNDAFAKMFGYGSPDSVMSINVQAFYKNPEERTDIIKHIRSRGKINNYELAAITKNGQTKNVIFNAVLEGDIISGMVMDITERKKAEMELLRLTQRLDAQWKLARMVDSDQKHLCDLVLNEIVSMTGSLYGFYGLFDEDTGVMNIHAWSDEVMKDCMIHDKSLSFPIEKSGVWGNAVRHRNVLIINDYHAEEHPNKKGLPEGHVAIQRLMVIPVFRQERIVALGAVANKTEDYKAQDADQMNAFLQSAQLIQDKHLTDKELKRHRENLLQLVAERTGELQKVNEQLEEEIAERIQAEKLVKRMALFAELNPSPVIRFDGEGKVLMANPAAVEILNLGPLTDMTLTSLIPDIKELDLASCIRDGTILSHNVLIGERCFHFIFRGLPELEIGHVYGSDITEQKKAEAETLRAGQLASVGELAAGVAHEINNPINGIINFAQILSDKTIKGSFEHNAANQIIREGDRIASIVMSLLSFARNEQDERSLFRVGDILSASLSLTQSQLRREGIKLILKIRENLPEVKVNFQQIEQVCLNVINNARYALNQKHGAAHNDKVLEIRAEKVRVGKWPYVRATFYDNGAGVPSDLLQTIMSPFVSTKPKGLGTGLGLSISHEILKKHHGHLHIESVEGEFTKVTIDLPYEIGAKK